MERIEETPLDTATHAEQPSSPGDASTSEDLGSRSLSPVETSMKSASLMEDSFDYPDDEVTRNKMIAAAIQQEDEFLEYLMSLPAAAGTKTEKKEDEEKGDKDEKKKEKRDRKSGSKKPPPLFRSTSEKVGATVGLDHLDNLCRLMEQLGDLREKNSKLQRRVQYLEDLKKLQEMHSQLQQETKTRRQREAEILQTLQRQRDLNFTSNSPRRSKKLTRQRQSLQPSSQKRERSQSVGIDELNDFQNDHNLSNKQTKRRQRRSIAEFTSGNKGKVSKWTKVKEAFRWEKASVVMLPETKSQDSGLGGISGHHGCEDGGRYLRVPVSEMLSGSPSADSVISAHSMCSSGGPSTGEYVYMPLTTTMISSSSSSEELDFDYNYSDIMLEMGPLRSASATESTMGVPTSASKEPRRLSLRQMPEEEDASRRSKSLDGDESTGSIHTTRHFADKEELKPGTQHNKSHKTPWGKVKDIIQTRKDSLKHRQPSPGDSVKHRQHGGEDSTRHRQHGGEDSARHRQYGGEDSVKYRQHGNEDNMKHRQHGSEDVLKYSQRDGTKRRPQRKTYARDHDKVASDLDDAAPVLDPVETPLGDGVQGASPSRDESVDTVKPRPRIEVTSEPSRRHKTSTTSLGNNPDPTLTSRRLTPMLTITLPSTEELSLLHTKIAKCNTKPPPSPQSEERLQKLSASSAQSGEEGAAGTKTEYRQQTSVSAGTSPPVHRRSSKWTKVKKAFLTSTAHAHRDDDVFCSVPSSPNRTSSFFYETDPEELSGGELAEGMGDDYNTNRHSASDPSSVQAEIQRNYEALQQKLSQEFHKKLHEWEKMKASGSSGIPSCSRTGASATGSADENFHHDKGFRRKMEEWERMKHKEGVNSSKRESVALHQLDEDNLSPHFKKKLQEWQRIKKIGPREDSQQSRKRLVEWQLWRTGSGKQGSDEQQDDFQRKLQEWERIKSASPCESPTSKEAGTDSDRNSSGAKTPSPGVARKNSTGYAKKKVASGGNGGGKAIPKAKTQKEKELHWLEKELQKIEREKQRLEREREKYLEREARLEKMRRAVGSNHPGNQEVLVQTSTGFFRFQGISEKFTRRLYEWEKARGIAPEASTFALLDPGYRPPGGADSADNGMLTRSKSASSVTNLTGGNGLGATMTHHQSSLSLNDVDALEQAAHAADARASSEPELRDNDDEQEDDEPSAVIVDIEDVVEETAELLAAAPVVKSETPVYCYAPEEVTRLIDSSGSDSERDNSALVRRTDSVRTESSYKLIEENMSLLSKLQHKGEICRKLETDLEDLEEKIVDVTKTYEEELERLRQEENEVQDLSNARVVTAVQGERSGDQRALVDTLRARIQALDRRQERLRREGVSLQDSFVEHSEQQTALAQNLVGKMKQLQQVNSNMASFELDPQNVTGCLTGRQEDAVALVQGLSTQLLTLAEKLEVALGERSREIQSLRHELADRRRDADARRMSRGLSVDTCLSLSMGSLTGPEVNLNQLHHPGPYLPRQSSVELTQLPSLLTSKVLELKQGLNFLCSTSSEFRQNVPPSPEETTTFVLKLSPKKQASKQAAQNAVTTSVEEPSSPITLVTITPAFMMKSPKIVKEMNLECENKNMLEARKRRASETPSQEDLGESFGSAVSSSASSLNGERERVLDSEEKVVKKEERFCVEEKPEDNVDGEHVKVKKNSKLCRKGGVLSEQKRLVETKDEPLKLFNSRRSSDTLVAYKRNKLDNTLASSTKSRPLADVGQQEAGSNPELISPVNVFVPTTRKIFSPVRRDSKGKASSVISYVVEEENEPHTDTPPCPTTEMSPRQGGIPMTPQWMHMRSRSQSASPALPRKMLQDDSFADGSGGSYRGPRFSLDSGERNLSKEVLTSSSGSIAAAHINIEQIMQTNLKKDVEQKPQTILRTNSQKESSADREKRDLIFNVSRPTTPLGFPPLPPSPSPGRRDLFKQIAKDTAPSIRMMIAKYNQKLTEQDGGRSPEVGGSGSGSPVAWRSPVAERRVRAQMAKYQEEVQRVLQQGSRRIGRMGYGEVQKSASAGFIRSHDSSSSQSSSKNDSSDEKPGTPSVVRRGILKSSSAGSIKSVSILPLSKQIVIEPKVIKSIISPSETTVPTVMKISTKDLTGNGSETPDPLDSPRFTRSPVSPASPASSTMGSPPISRLRALRLQRAKEEFLTRGPGGRSWTSDGDTPLTGTPSMSMSPEPQWVRDVAGCSGESGMNRLSQISVGSESSYDSQVLPFTPEEEDDNGLLIKSASAGMINVDSKTFKKFTLEKNADNSSQTTIKEKPNSNTKFGISSIASKFRKVKMRKNKDKECGGKTKLNTVTLLCRQSLLVDINKKESAGEGPSTSKSCPSSPVLQRTMSTENTTSGDDPANRSTGSWILNPAKKIFKPK